MLLARIQSRCQLQSRGFCLALIMLAPVSAVWPQAGCGLQFDAVYWTWPQCIRVGYCQFDFSDSGISGTVWVDGGGLYFCAQETQAQCTWEIIGLCGASCDCRSLGMPLEGVYSFHNFQGCGAAPLDEIAVFAEGDSTHVPGKIEFWLRAQVVAYCSASFALKASQNGSPVNEIKLTVPADQTLSSEALVQIDGPTIQNGDSLRNWRAWVSGECCWLKITNGSGRFGVDPLKIQADVGSCCRDFPTVGRVTVQWDHDELGDMKSCVLAVKLEGEGVKPRPWIVDPDGREDFTTIQEAIDAIDDSCCAQRVLVKPGEYLIRQPIDFKGKGITVLSEAGPVDTIIRMDRSPTDLAQASVVVFQSQEGSDAVLEGFTLTGGRGQGPGCAIGGGLYVAGDSSPIIRNCVISGNSAGSGGGVYCSSDSSLTLTNCTITGNSAQYVGGGVVCDVGSSVTLTSCIVWENWGGSLLSAIQTHTQASFSCIETAEIWPGNGNINTDPIFCGWGAHLEVWVDPASPGPGDGSPGKPFSDVRAATNGYSLVLSTRSPCLGAGQGGADMGAITGRCDGLDGKARIVHLADGTYQAEDLDLVHGVSLLGSCADTTVLEGTVRAPRTGSMLSNLTVTKGTMGGIVVPDGEEPVITNCTIAENSGSGVYCYNASPTLTNCTISGNSAISGGGVLCGSSSPTFTNCTISGNSASYGGGVWCEDSSPTFTNCTISGNSASYGGGVWCEDSSPTFTNCTISENTSVESGGGVSCWGSSPTLTNCTISGNLGGVCCYDFSSPTLTNCIVWGNVGDSVELSDDSSTPVVTYSCIQGADLWAGLGNINADPRFLGDVDFHLQPDSPCMDTGTSEGAPTTDIEGNTRPCGAAVDMGAYEYGPVFQLALTSAAVAECAPASVFVLLTNEGPVQAFSLGFAHDPAIATLTAIDYVDCPVIQALRNGQGPDYFGVDLNPGTGDCSPEVTAGGTVYCIASQTQPSTETILAGIDQPIARLTYEAILGNAVGVESSLTIVGCLGGDLPREVVLTVDGLSVFPPVVGGILTVDAAACQFKRGDANADSRLDISDAVTVLIYLFENGRGPLRCEDAGDANDDGVLDIGDAIAILSHLFAHAGPLKPPFGECGIDPTEDGLDCLEFGPCQ